MHTPSFNSFSHQSSAHDAQGQAAELTGLLYASHVRQPVMLVGYSSSAPVARVFAARYPDKTAGLFLIEPWMPELEVAMPGGPADPGGEPAPLAQLGGPRGML